LLERLGSGYNHSLIGAGLAASWGLPAALIDTIRFHHIPLECPLQNRELVFTIHLADSAEHYRKGELRYAAIRPQVLERFSIDSEENFSRFIKRFV
jgi:HD-like signal output (HDOD) protein